MSDETALQKARHGMSLLWEEITHSREVAGELLQKVEHLMSVHDDTKAILGECVSLFDSIKSAKASSDASADAQIADLKDQATSLRDEMKAFANSMSGNASDTALANDASSQGASTVHAAM